MIKELIQNKIIELGQLLSTKEVQDINNYLSFKPLYQGHVKRANEGSSETATCYDLETIVCAPYLLEVGLYYTSLAKQYLECEPYLYSMNIFNTWPSVPTQGDIQEFHVDSDDEKFVGLFIYLTDVLRLEDGAHQFKHNDILRTILGPAGTGFMADTSNYHRGIKPNKPRRLAWMRWGINSPTRTNQQDGIIPIDHKLLGKRYNKVNARLLSQIII